MRRMLCRRMDHGILAVFLRGSHDSITMHFTVVSKKIATADMPPHCCKCGSASIRTPHNPRKSHTFVAAPKYLNHHRRYPPLGHLWFEIRQ
jgi:hypothetical protein